MNVSGYENVELVWQSAVSLAELNQPQAAGTVMMLLSRKDLAQLQYVDRETDWKNPVRRPLNELEQQRILINTVQGAVHLDVPEGVTSLDVSFDFLSPATGGEFGQSVPATPDIVDLEWNQVLLYPAGAPAKDITFTPSVKLPEGWHYAISARTHGTPFDDLSAVDATVALPPVLNAIEDIGGSTSAARPATASGHLIDERRTAPGWTRYWPSAQKLPGCPAGGQRWPTPRSGWGQSRPD